MILSGKIGPFSVAEIFQFLAHSRITGQLVIDTGKDRAWVYFHKGELIYARRRGPTERIGERLLRLGYISESQLLGANLRVGMSSQKRRIGQIFLEAGSVDQQTLQKVVRDQIREIVTQVIFISHGDFCLYEGRLPEDEDILLDVSLDLLLLEGLKKMDELTRDQRLEKDGNHH